MKAKTHKGVGGCSCGAVVVVFDQSVDTVKLSQHCGQYLACIEVSGAFGSVYLISAYFNFKCKTEKHLERLKDFLKGLEGKDILIAADVNAKSILWGSKATDAKGELVEEVIHEHWLVILNQPGNPAYSPEFQRLRDKYKRHAGYYGIN